MGFSKKHQAEGGVESEGKKWVIAGIASRSPLKPISTKPTEIECSEDSEEACSTTPTSRESRIPEKLPCPPAPRKRRTSSSRCHHNGAAMEFFIPPDLESVFRPRAGRAN